MDVRQPMDAVSAPFKIMKEGYSPSLFLLEFLDSGFCLFAASFEIFFLFKRERGLLGFFRNFFREILKDLRIESGGINRAVLFHIAFLELQAM
jgi:hypothetical protein